MCGHVNVAKWAAQVNLAITQWTSQRPRGRASDNAAAVHSAAGGAVTQLASERPNGKDAATTRASGQASDNAAAIHGAKPTEERDSRLIHY